MSKIRQNHHFNEFQNQPQPLHTTIPLTILTNTTISDPPIYFLSTLTISTSHTINALLLRLFDKFVIFTSKLQRLFQYLYSIFFSSTSTRLPVISILNLNYFLFLRALAFSTRASNVYVIKPTTNTYLYCTVRYKPSSLKNILFLALD